MIIHELQPTFPFFLVFIISLVASLYGCRLGYEIAQMEVLCYPDIFYWQASEKHPKFFAEVENIARKNNMGPEISFPRRAEDRTPNKWAY